MATFGRPTSLRLPALQARGLDASPFNRGRGASSGASPVVALTATDKQQREAIPILKRTATRWRNGTGRAVRTSCTRHDANQPTARQYAHNPGNIIGRL
jgi:hypothetical protein